MTRRPPSLFARLVVLIAAVLVAGAVLLGYAAWSYARLAADEAYDRLLLGAALQIAETVTTQDGQVLVDPPVSAFETLSLSENDRIFYKVTDPRGAVLTGDEGLQAAAPRGGPSEIPTVSDGRYREVPVRIATIGRYVLDPDVQGWTTVTVAQTREGRTALAWDLTVTALLLVLGMSILALAAAMIAIRRALAPLSRIELALQARDPKDLHPLQVDAPREIQTLVTAINHFMDRLSNRVGAMQRFIADAAHQLRTPLTALASQVDLLAGETREDRRAHAVARISERTTELGRLANQLLSHAMVVHRAEAIPFRPVDLVAVARRALHDGAPLASERDVAIAFEAPAEPVLVDGDPVSLREALANVIHNAMKHGARTRLHVEVGREGQRAFVAVVDDGPGIPPADWARIRQPFQDRGGGRAGSSLGLAIVSDVMQAHGGELAFEPRDGAFAVRLTLAARREAADGPAGAELAA